MLNGHGKQQPQEAFTADIIPRTVAGDRVILHEHGEPMVHIGVGFR